MAETGKIVKKEEMTPASIVSFGQETAKLLKNIVEKAKWVVKIQGKDYLQFEAWQTLARFYGYTVKTVETKYVVYGNVKGFESKAVVLDKEGKEVGGAEAGCYSDERNWVGKPLYSLKSMAQTRASAKALRQILSWVVVLAGYKPTPAEEIDDEAIQEDKQKTCQHEWKEFIAKTNNKKYKKCFKCGKFEWLEK